MALDKNKTGIMAAISAAAVAQTPNNDRAHPSLPKGTVGSVRASLGGIQEIDTALILSWGPQDRLELTAVNSDAQTGDVTDLAESIQHSGQQIPVLLRPSAERDGHFDVIYGRRRILACEQLGIPVKALIRSLDDAEALMAKGLENASRTELSFYERARFAQAILDQGYTRDDVMQALAISKNTLSQLERCVRTVPTSVGDAIGAAPSAGRPKWHLIATAFEKGGLDIAQVKKVIENLPANAGSDARMGAVLDLINKRGARQERPNVYEPAKGVSMKSNGSSVTLTIERENFPFFADWFDKKSETLIRQLFNQHRTDEEYYKEVGEETRKQLEAETLAASNIEDPS